MRRAFVLAKHLCVIFLFSFLAASGVHLLFPAMRLDLGGGPDGYLDGFYGSEQSGGHAFRWTKGDASVRFPGVGSTSHLWVDVEASAWRYQDRVFTATVTIDGLPIGEISKAGWRNWRFQVVDPAVLEGGTAVVGIHAEPFVMSDLYPDSVDSRPVGVMVDSVQLEPAARGNLLEAGEDEVKRALDAPFVVMLVLGWAWYLWGRLRMSSGRALASALCGIVGFAACLAMFWSEATLRVMVFGACAGISWVVLGDGVGGAREGVGRRLRGWGSEFASGLMSGKYESWLVVAVGVLFALALRFSLFWFESTDYHLTLHPWFVYLQQNGFSAFRDNFYNYTPPYLYLLYIMTAAFPDVAGLAAVKCVSVLFDFACAVLAWKIVRLKYNDSAVPNMAFLAVLFAPTVLVNSSVWGQCDSILAAGVLAFVYYAVTYRSARALVCLGAAFAFKPQAAFMAPLLLILVIRGSVRWRELTLAPLTYLFLAVPAWLAGRGLLDILTVYINQPDVWLTLTVHAATLYAWLPNSAYSALLPAGFVFAAFVVAAFVALIARSSLRLDTPVVVELAVASAILMPFVLPRVMDRYFFAADVLSIVFAFYNPGYAFVAVGMSLISLFSYSAFLLHVDLVSLQLLALGTLTLIVALSYHLFVVARAAWRDGSPASPGGLAVGRQ